MNKKNLRYQNVWIFIGCFMIAFVVFETLTSSPIKPGFKISDKFMHIVGYFGMMGWFVQIFQKNRERLVLAIGFVILGIMLEFIQGWGGVRQYEVADMLANTTGVIAAWILAKTRFSRILLAIELALFNKKR